MSNYQLTHDDKQIDAINKSTDVTNKANDAFTKTLDETVLDLRRLSRAMPA